MQPLTAILVNYNAGPDLAVALQSIADACGDATHETFVIDNASTDDSAAIAATFGTDVRLVRNDRNVGFGRAVNQGLALSSSPLILIMNPDCRLSEGALEAMAAELERDPATAIVGPRILNPDGSEQGSARGDPDMLTGLFGRNSRLRQMFPALAVSRRNVIADARLHAAAGAMMVDWVSGACMLCRRDALQKAGGFDERYFLYWEDADLCRRLRALGYAIRYVPAAIAVHRVGQSSRTARASSIRAFHRSAYLYYATHVAPGTFHPKRILARALLTTRCWLRLVQDFVQCL